MSPVFTPPAHRHERHWMLDGNIVVSAISQEGMCTVLFRLQKTMLADQSEVFESMFSLPQGEENVANDADYYDAVPLVRLPDTAEEVEGLLDALRDPLSLAEPTANSDTPLRIRKALHLASKYLMTDLRSKLVRIVEREWPSSLDDMEVRDQAYEEFAKYNKYNMSRTGWPTIFTPEPAAAIALAEEFGIDSILPFAYYDLTRCSPSRSWDTCLPSEGQSFVETCLFQGKAARWECLSSAAILRMLRLRDLLCEQNRRFKAYLDLPGDGLHQSHGEAARHLMDEVLAEATTGGDFDQYYVLRYLRLLRTKNMRDLCGVCRPKFLQDVYRLRDTIWGKIVKSSRSSDSYVCSM